VTPLGTCHVVAPVSQNRVVSTVRGTEVVSDSTNVLAQLTGNAKERCLVSCLATERLTSLTAPASRP
jgi:hypothetical protein